MLNSDDLVQTRILLFSFVQDILFANPQTNPSIDEIVEGVTLLEPFVNENEDDTDLKLEALSLAKSFQFYEYPASLAGLSDTPSLSKVLETAKTIYSFLAR